MAELRLEVREFRDLTRWRWVLTDASGAFVADHEVRLNRTDWQFEAFGDLPFYLEWHVAPDRRTVDEARIVGEVGEWIGSSILGTVGSALLGRRTAVVHVVVPHEARDLLMRPLELAHVGGRPLSVQDVTLVMSIGSDPVRPTPVGERLRVLGLFSLPEGRRALNLRRERKDLVRLIEGIAATGKAADVRALQYGVTRAALRDVLEEAEGWDIIHVAGHGRPGSLLLETASGDPDLVAGPELADLLGLARGRLKLVTVSACWSAAVAAGEQRRLLGLPDDDAVRDSGAGDAGAKTVPEALATGLAERLGCAVLAMRYTVNDGFALELARKLYDLLVDKGQPLGRSVGMTLRSLSSDAGAHSPLAVATPALFGEVAADLRLAAPARLGPLSYDASILKMAGFPPQSDRFVGRTGVMARSSAALAARSGVPGVLLHGMPGGGKTACALELAHGHEHGFDRLVWFRAPDEGVDISGSLTDFALTLERFLNSFQMAHLVGSAGQLSGFLPQLTELMERRRLLIVIDNLESLLTEDGSWRDDRWASVVGALCAHNGLGRVVLTSRRVPATGVATLDMASVDALSADEALLLVRDLPHLQALGLGKVPGIDRFTSRQLARRAIEAAQGHPKLLELANGQAAHPDRLTALVEVGDQAWRVAGGLPEGFFTEGTSSATGADYLQILTAWTRSVTDTLTPGDRDLFWALCCLEEADRIRPVLQSVWDGLLQRLDGEGEPAGLEVALAAAAAAGLLSIRPETVDLDESYAVHPGVAEASRDLAGQPFRNAVDTEAAAYWHAIYRQALGADGGGSVHTRLLVRAGLAAVPYLTRQQQWGRAAALLEDAFASDPSRANAAAVLPAIEQITQHAPRQDATLARVLEVIDPAAGEARARAALNTATGRGDLRAAAVITARLADRCASTGRLAEALALTEQTADYARQAGLGPWTQLDDQVTRLRVLTVMGQARQVLDEVTRLRAHMDTLPATPGPDETATPWDVREALFDTGRHVAILLERWDDALDFNAAITSSRRDRDAPRARIARVRFNDYAPLIHLRRTQEALTLLQDCLAIFRDAHDTLMIGNTLGALADVEEDRGHGDTAIRLISDALRYFYLADDVPGIAGSYYNLGSYLHRDARQPAIALATHLAAALIRALAGSDEATHQIDAAALDLREFGSVAVPPANVADLCDRLADIPGTDLPGLLATLSSDFETAERTLHDLVAQAQATATRSRWKWWPWPRGRRRPYTRLRPRNDETPEPGP